MSKFEDKPLEITKPLPLADARHIYETYFAEMTRLDENDIVCNVKCKFCNHPMRFEAEELWEQTRSVLRLKSFFDKYRKEKPDDPHRYAMNSSNIRAHIYNHYFDQQRKIRVREYCARLPELLEHQLQQDRLFDMLLVTMQERYLDVVSDEAMEKAKRSDAIIKLVGQMLKVVELQARLKGELRTVHVMAEKFLNVWVNAIQSEQDDTVKRRLIEALDIFKEQIGEFTVENE